jgi:hypothetical protein
MNDKFFAAPIGQETHKVLNRLVNAVSLDIVKLPFTARIVRAKGQQVHFNVGTQANVHVGDVLMAYRLSEDPLIDGFTNNQLGYPESPFSSLIVKRVQPLFAIGELDVKNTDLKEGDIVRFKW